MLHAKLQQHVPVVVTVTDSVVTQYSWSDCVISVIYFQEKGLQFSVESFLCDGLCLKCGRVNTVNGHKLVAQEGEA